MANLKNTDTWQTGTPDWVKEPGVKVILLGNTNVGKTSLVARYVKNKYHQFSQETIGAAFWEKNVKVRGKMVKLDIWDTAGEERYRSIVRLYYRDAKAALVCFDLTNRKSWGDVTYWIKELVDKECYTTSSLSGQGVGKLFEDVAIYNTSFYETLSTGIENSTVVLPQSTDSTEKKESCAC